jgi:hypothetical protein
MTLNWGMREEQTVNDHRERLLGDARGVALAKKFVRQAILGLGTGWLPIQHSRLTWQANKPVRRLDKTP